ncbi:response regulator [Methylorubrum salsuginis]|uniref:CheY chemotaxis protein or a CheY-like REC (Receiver) domain n=1 Tax=Methylorubrum salsuginis TaxID=414703 RepID=A0A1I4BQK3_9HYPH|nr:response regulator [Methylorubrum salsuginis]SFK71112.1 CheY chemotaxis protein or a CheY-like REC (receiver) domain [Methylorubrum salsuginis]
MVSRNPLSGLRILIVEDDYFTAQDTRRIIERAGGTVIGPFGDLPEVMATGLSQPLDAAVVDIGLRGETAYRLADALDARGVPYLFATAYDAGVVPERFAGVPLLQKPFGGPDLVRLVAGLKGSSPAGSAG